MLVYSTKCKDVECCNIRIEVCIKLNYLDERIFEPGYPKQIPTNNNYWVCDNAWGIYPYFSPSDFLEPLYYMKPCTPLCDWLTDMYPEVAAKMISEYTDSENADYYQLSDYHAEDKLSISYSSKEASHIEIIIYDEVGNTIDSKDFSFTSGFNSFIIDTKNYISGTYYYVILLDNKLLKSNQFIIVR